MPVEIPHHLAPARIEFFPQPLSISPPKTENLVNPQYTQPDGLLSLIGLVSDLRNVGLQVVSLAGGLPPTSPFLDGLWQDYYLHSAKELAQKIPTAEALQYGNSAGNLRFRQQAAKDVSILTGKEIKPADILTVPGSQYAISNALLTFCAGERKVVLTPVPTYSAFLEAAAVPMNIPVIGVESDEQGMLPASLRKTILTLKEKGVNPGLAYTMIFGNPTGGVMSDERGAELNAICKEYGIPMVADYAYNRLSTNSSSATPTIPYLDDNVILLFTASKTYAPGERLGWAVIPDPEKYKRMQATKQAQMIMSPPPPELELLHFIETGAYEARIPQIAARYQLGIDEGMKAVHNNSNIFRVVRPDAGMFLWVEVPKGLSTHAHLGRILHDHHVAYSPGTWFQPRQLYLPDGTLVGPEMQDNFMRLCVVTENPETVTTAINTLAQAFREIAEQEGISMFAESSGQPYTLSILR